MRARTLLFVLLVGCGGGGATEPIRPVVDGGPADGQPAVDGAPGLDAGATLDAAPVDALFVDGADLGVWTDEQKCEFMCGAYCAARNRCDGTPVDECRATVDQRNGGTCAERASLFHRVSQGQVQECISAVGEMTCPAFDDLYTTGVGLPSACDGILH